MLSLLFLCFVLAWTCRKVCDHFAAKAEKEFMGWGEVSMVEILDEIKALTQKGDKNAKIAFIADMMNMIFIFAGYGCVFFMVGRSLDG